MVLRTHHYSACFARINRSTDESFKMCYENDWEISSSVTDQLCRAEMIPGAEKRALEAIA